MVGSCYVLGSDLKTATGCVLRLGFDCKVLFYGGSLGLPLFILILFIIRFLKFYLARAPVFRKFSPRDK